MYSFYLVLTLSYEDVIFNYTYSFLSYTQVLSSREGGGKTYIGVSIGKFTDPPPTLTWL